MVIVEGVARGLDPQLNLWTAAEPVAKEWLDTNLGLQGRLREAGEGAELMGRVLADMPRFLSSLEATAQSVAQMSRSGWKLDDDTVDRLARAGAKRRRGQTAAIWVGAVALSLIALSAILGP